MKKQDYYQTLGLQRNATQAEIKKAYRKKALQSHPDSNPNDPTAEAKFKEISEAYNTLKNPKKRAQYDRFGHQKSNYHQQHFHFQDIMQEFGMPFGQPATRQGANLRIKLNVTMEEIAHGVNKEVKIDRAVPCRSCNSSGAAAGTRPTTCQQCNGTGRNNSGGFVQALFGGSSCHHCNGQGKTITKECQPCQGKGRQHKKDQVIIQLPPGVQDSTEYIMKGKGNYPLRGGIPGNLHIHIQELSHTKYRRRGNNVHYNHYISYTDALFGATIQIPTLYGPTEITLPPHTQSDTILRLRSKGLPYLNSSQKGDQHIHIHIWVPQKLTTSEKKKLMPLVDLLKNHPPQQS